MKRIFYQIMFYAGVKWKSFEEMEPIDIGSLEIEEIHSCDLVLDLSFSL